MNVDPRWQQYHLYRMRPIHTQPTVAPHSDKAYEQPAHAHGEKLVRPVAPSKLKYQRPLPRRRCCGR